MMEIVWIVPESCWGVVLSRYYGYVKVSYDTMGLHMEEIFENSEVLEPKDMGIDYETE